MTTDTLNSNSNLLKGLFAKKDFQFLSNCSKEIEKLEIEIRKQQIKRDTIIRFINRLHSIIPDEKANEFENVFLEAQRYLDIVITNINMLSSIFNKISELEKSTKCSLLEAITTDSTLKLQVEQCIEEYQQISNTFFVNDLKVEHYLKEISSNKYIQNIKQKLSSFIKTDFVSLSANKDNNKLILSESSGIAILPYTLEEVQRIMDLNPDRYFSQEDAIKNHFVFPIERFTKQTVKARFRETYNLLHKRENKPRITSLRYSFNLAFCYKLNPAIIASCKSLQQLNYYLSCLESNCLYNFNLFEIQYEINPLSI